MPSVKLNRKVLERVIGKRLSEEELKEKISMLGTDLEGVTKDFIDVEVFPNRPDLLSEQGLGRALSSFVGGSKGLKRYNVKKSDYKLVIDKGVKEVRPWTACAVVKGLKFDDDKIKEIIQIQEKLHITYGRNRKKVAIGVYPCEKIKFPIKFVAKDPKEVKFIPLEFDKELDGLQILSKHPAGRDYGHLLEGLDKFPFFIDANNKELSMPQIINSHDVGKISSETKDVFIECSGFDYSVLSKCLNMIVCALSDMGGAVYSIEMNAYGKKIVTPCLEPVKMGFDLNYVNKYLGLELKSAKKYLEMMGYGVVGSNVLIPCYRADILHQIDIVEDIAIAYGYDNFVEEIPDVATIGSESQFEIFKNKLADVLVGLGLLEVNTYNIVSKESVCSKMNIDFTPVNLFNALNKEYNVLRTWVVPSLMQVFSLNKHNEYPQNIFGYGSVFHYDGSVESNVKEDVRLGVALCGKKVDYTSVRQILDVIFDALGMKYKIDNVKHESFIVGRVGRVVVSGVKVAYIGEIHPLVLSNWDLDVPVSAFELNVTELFKEFKK